MIEHKTALITGASRGIGRAIAIATGAMGYFTVVHYNQRKSEAEETLREIINQGGCGATAGANLSSADDRLGLINLLKDTAGRIDILVNNAGMAPKERIDLLDMSEASYDEVMATNLKGPFFLTQVLAGWMIELGKTIKIYDPCIINIGSISSYTSSTNRGEYCISKAGVGMMTQLFADRLAKHGVRVYEIRPGIIDTDMTAGVRPKYDALIENGLTPIQRWGKSEDVARAVEGILSGMLPFSTGEVIHVDGGFHLRRL